MTNSVYILHDLQTNEKIVIKGYEAYIQFFTEQLKPFGYGTRYLFSEITRVAQYYHLRLVSEKPGYVGGVRNAKAPVQR